MNPHQKPQEDVVEKLRAALRPLALADIDVSGTAACGITREDIIRAVDAYEASAGATSAYEAGRRDMREGWVLVPREPTEAMLEAASIIPIENGRGGCVCLDDRETIRFWTDMIAAALPTEPLGEEG